MTIKEISGVVGCSGRTVRREIKKQYPAILKQGIRTVLNKEQATSVVKELRSQIKNEVKILAGQSASIDTKNKDSPDVSKSEYYKINGDRIREITGRE